VPDRSPVAIQKIAGNDIQAAVDGALELIGAARLMRAGMRVLLKPNVLMAAAPERGVTTDPEVLRAVIRWCRSFGPASIHVADSCGGMQTAGSTAKAMEVSGIAAVCREEGVTCVPFEQTPRVLYKVSSPSRVPELHGSALLRDSDLIVNLPKVKTHAQTILTCCIKNMFGTMILNNKAAVHAGNTSNRDFAAALVDVYSVSRPQLTVIDGRLCMEGRGPSGGTVVPMDLILAGFDPVALDGTVCRLIGLDPARVLHLEEAERRGLGRGSPDSVRLLGTPLEEVRRAFAVPRGTPSLRLPPRLADAVSRTVFKGTVSFDAGLCVRCGTCWKSCPVSAIAPPESDEPGAIPVWDRSRCVTCFCCEELCPHGAARVGVNPVRNLLRAVGTRLPRARRAPGRQRHPR
jgi:uncharacterized protein (DUF362 family)/Pyruvate/2-oxoacid:ferredoxin oxidoreductase delta subunit